MSKVLYLVLPCYNEEHMIQITNSKLCELYDKLIGLKIISSDSKILYVNDGSKDKTWDYISKYYSECEYVSGINLAKNKGQQNALYAGLMVAKEKADMVITLDVDLQDDINAILKMIDEYNNGANIVYGVRSSRKKDTFFKRNTAQLYYKLMAKLGIDMVYNHADFRLMDKKVLDALSNYKEADLVLRSVIPMIGFKTAIVEYERQCREDDVSKYTLSKMIDLAMNTLLSFTKKPVRLILYLGILLSVFGFISSLVFGIIYFIKELYSVWFIISIICLFSGIQTVCIGVVGEYVAQTNMEVKNRPKYIIEDQLLTK